MALVNTQYFDDQIARMNACGSCSDLQEAIASLKAGVADIEAAAQAELAKLNAWLALVTPPGANPAAIVAWIQNLIDTTIMPYVNAIETYTSELALLPAELQRVIAAAENAAKRFPNCSIA